MKRLKAAALAFRDPRIIEDTRQNKSVAFPVIKMDSDDPADRAAVRKLAEGHMTVAEWFRQEREEAPHDGP